MLTLETIAQEKIRAKALGFESKFRLEIYNQMLDATMYDKKTGYCSFIDFGNKEEFKTMLEIARNIKANDYELSRHIVEIDSDEEDLSIEVTFSIEQVKGL